MSGAALTARGQVPGFGGRAAAQPAPEEAHAVLRGCGFVLSSTPTPWRSLKAPVPRRTRCQIAAALVFPQRLRPASPVSCALRKRPGLSPQLFVEETAFPWGQSHALKVPGVTATQLTDDSDPRTIPLAGTCHTTRGLSLGTVTKSQAEERRLPRWPSRDLAVRDLENGR